MWDLLYYLLVLLFVAGLAAALVIFILPLLKGQAGANFFGGKPERRLEVIEQTNIDARRKLVMIRRDNVEHLIMTGGPVDVVVETGIGAPKTTPNVAADPPKAVFSRQPRTLGQAQPSGSQDREAEEA